MPWGDFPHQIESVGHLAIKALMMVNGCMWTFNLWRLLICFSPVSLLNPSMYAIITLKPFVVWVLASNNQHFFEICRNWIILVERRRRNSTSLLPKVYPYVHVIIDGKDGISYLTEAFFSLSVEDRIISLFSIIFPQFKLTRGVSLCICLLSKTTPWLIRKWSQVSLCKLQTRSNELTWTWDQMTFDTKMHHMHSLNRDDCWSEPRCLPLLWQVTNYSTHHRLCQIMTSLTE